VIEGGGITTKVESLKSLPTGVVTPINPLVAPVGTVIMIWFESTTVNVVEAPLRVTDVAPLKPVPLMVTEDPIAPASGLKLRMTGGGELPAD